MDFQEVGWEGREWIDLAKDRDRGRVRRLKFGFHKIFGIS
jgi:hypothetical protein